MFNGLTIKRLRSLLLIAALCSTVFIGVSFPGTKAVAQQTSAPITYTVQPGDTLFRIALYYGVTVDALTAANHLVDPSHIEVGQVLTIPLGSIVNTNPSAPVYAIPYTVQQGDTLQSIASRYGTTPEAVAAANGIMDPNLIFLGEALTIPSSLPPPTIAPTVPPTATVPPTNTPLPTDTLAPTETVAPTQTIAPSETSQPTETSAVTQVVSTATPVPTIVPPTATLIPTIAPPTVTPVPVNLRTHIVAPGEELSKIAESYGVNVADIIALNQINNPDLIYAGMVLKIPNSSVSPAAAISGPPPSNPIGVLGNDAAGKQIIVVLHEQRVYIYQDGKLIRSVLVSTGLPGSPTVLGHYNIYVKYPAQLMVGPGYYLPDVPWVMYFYEGYGLHGTYWHHNWGHPMSHGCVNMPTDEAAWLYNWAPVGTSVTVIA